MKNIALQISSDDFMILLGLMLLLVFILTIMDSARRRRRFKFELPKIKTELKCLSCGLKEIRDFKQGDYISKLTGEKCKRCGGDLTILSIYTITPKETTW